MIIWRIWRGVEMVDKPVSKTGGLKNRESSSLSRATNLINILDHEGWVPSLPTYYNLGTKNYSMLPLILLS